MRKFIGICPKCGEICKLAIHHILPVRFYGKQKKPLILLLCRTCHDQIETLIPYKHKLREVDYINIAKNFLREGKQNEMRSLPRRLECMVSG